MTGTSRPLLLLVILLVATAAFAGCTQRDDGTDDDRAGTADGTDTVRFLLRGVQSPEGADQAVVNMTVEHIAFFDATNNEWVPLLTDSTDAAVLFADGDTQATFLTEIPVLSSDYNAVEFVVERARVITDEGATDAEVPRVACYAPLDLGAQGDGSTIQLELILSGAEALERTDEGWHFQPALIGTDSDAAEGGIEVTEPDCMPF